MAPRFAGYLSRNPGVIGAMLDVGYLSTLPGARRQVVQFRQTANLARDFEDLLNRARIFELTPRQFTQHHQSV